ncbi:MAG: hypothetical protein P4M11_14275 [Candidatus Pacebacteria bacterium]|nr:hypothetical protein [Candidatus Paceibacterota bacterium]
MLQKKKAACDPSSIKKQLDALSYQRDYKEVCNSCFDFELEQEEPPMLPQLGLRAMPWLGKSGCQDLGWMYPLSAYAPGKGTSLVNRLPQSMERAISPLLHDFPVAKVTLLVINHSAAQFREEWAEDTSKYIRMKYAIHPYIFNETNLELSEPVYILASLHKISPNDDIFQVSGGISINAKDMEDPTQSCLRCAYIEKSSENEYVTKPEVHDHHMLGTTEFDIKFNSPVMSFFSCCAVIDTTEEKIKVSEIVIAMHTIISDHQSLFMRHLTPLATSGKLTDLLGDSRSADPEEEVTTLYASSLESHYGKAVQNITYAFSKRIIDLGQKGKKIDSGILHDTVTEIGKLLCYPNASDGELGETKQKLVDAFCSRFEFPEWTKNDFWRGSYKVWCKLEKQYLLFMLKLYMKEVSRPFEETKNWQKTILADYDKAKRLPIGTVRYCKEDEKCMKEHIWIEGHTLKMKAKYIKEQNKMFPEADSYASNAFAGEDILGLQDHIRYTKDNRTGSSRIPENLKPCIYEAAFFNKGAPQGQPSDYSKVAYLGTDNFHHDWWIAYPSKLKILEGLIDGLIWFQKQ